MRLLHAAAAACAVLAACAAIVAGGHVLSRSASGDAVAERLPERRDAASAEPLTAAIGKTGTAKPVQRSRTVDAETVAPPLPAGSELERIEPRAPLGDLALAVPPKPKRPDEWQGTKLSQPVAPKAGLIEAKGYSVAVSGIDIVGDDETCVYGGKSWACGGSGADGIPRLPARPRGDLRGAARRRPRRDRGAMPDRQAGCRQMAGADRLGPRRRGRTLCRVRQGSPVK